MAQATMVRTDEGIKVDIVDQLSWDTRVDAADVTVTVDNGRVTLGGSVPTYAAKLAAEDDAWVVAGVRAIQNQIAVTSPPGVSMPSDADLASRIRSRLVGRADLDLAMDKIAVSAVDGFVTLEGTVESYWKKVEAAIEALHVTGVMDVTNKLAVVPTAAFTDEAIARDIVSALDRNISTDVENIDVEVNNGTVTLAGTVPNRAARLAAYRAALYAAGVTDIEDNLLVA
jgi:osmotically-inducible protein OsmY